MEKEDEEDEPIEEPEEKPEEPEEEPEEPEEQPEEPEKPKEPEEDVVLDDAVIEKEMEKRAKKSLFEELVEEDVFGDEAEAPVEE